MAAITDEEATFSASSYANHVKAIPTMDGRRATNLDIRFSGSGSLDHTSVDDLELLEAMRLGHDVRLIVTGTIAGKGFRLGTTADGDISYSCTVRVATVEAGEAA